MNKPDICQFYFWDTKNATEVSEMFNIFGRMDLALIHTKLFMKTRVPLIGTLTNVVFKKNPASMAPPGQFLNLEKGDWVEVRSKEEIDATLDNRRRNNGLLFMPPMARFCGKRYRVFKKVEKIVLETTGELRRIKSPTVFLEGAYCDGKDYEGCDRSCYHFWREVWLKRIEADESIMDDETKI
jgi:hypothetical protein